MQAKCPWCQQAVEVPSGTALPGCCPGCGGSLGPLQPTLPPPETVTDHGPGAGAPADDRPPPQLGRYRITARLGSGGFGVVYKGHDEELRRDVAIKVPHRHRVTTPEDADAYLTEGQVLARLDHPGIVPVYDVGRTEDGLCYLVSKFIEGEDLATRLRAGRPAPAEAAGIVARVAEALEHAHRRGLVHRDIKPANILLDRDGQAYVADFGLALREEDFAHGPTFAGTPAYMSPEQARGEGHRVDGRTDIFSVGIVFYEMLTGQTPFQGQTVSELLEQIATREPQPPHRLDPGVPHELERVCLKALSKRAADRYASAQELADDLHHWLAQAQIAETTVQEEPGHPAPCDVKAEAPRVIPKGLRAFDALDADFFLELLPGPRDREGVPASVRFWKTRVDSTDPEVAFAVGLIYGPSGCGKSSLVRAGLLPRLAPRVTTVYVEAAPEGTERRVLGGLWHACPGLAGEMDLPVVLGDLRRGKALSPGRKLLIVLDQFEQFLHGEGQRLATSPLVATLRQADGARVQFLLLIRDDFWLAASRLFQELEIPLVEGRNLDLVDLFEPKHARCVLQLFGQAYGCLPADAAGMTAEQRAFLDEAEAGLTRDGKVIPVRLSLFAEMMKGRPWTPGSLRAVGGTEGVGLTFLQETFSAPAARPDRRAAEPAARGLLAALLPEPGSTIKGRVRSEAELLAASGLQGQPHRFERLLDLLDHDLRIITPAEGPAATAGQRFYQLTHDYLVRPLRDWLTQKKRETWRGRAELRLEERTAQWTRSPQDRFLPSPFEYAAIMLGVPRARRTPEERAMLRSATRLYGTWAGVALALLALVGGWTWELHGIDQGTRLVEVVKDAGPEQLRTVLKEDLPRYRRWANRRLHALADRPSTPPDQRLRASLALVEVDERQVGYLSGRLLDCPLEEFPLVRDGLKKYADRCTPSLWEALHDAGQPAGQRFQAGLALADYAPDAPGWTDADAEFLTGQLLRANRDDQRQLRSYLRPVAGRLLGALQRVFRDPQARGDLRLAAADALADPDYAGGRPELLARLASEATAEQYGVLQEALARATDSRELVLQALRNLVHEQPPTGAGERQRVEAGQRRAGAALTLLRLGERPGVYPVFPFQDDPEALTQFVHRLKDRGVPAEAVLDCLDGAPDVPSRFALLLALGEFRPDDLPGDRRGPLRDRLVEWYRTDPKSAVHGACGWLLRTWGFAGDVARVDRTPLPPDPAGRREWFVEEAAGDFITFVVFGPGTFRMGSPPSEEHRQANERQHQVRLTRAFAVADRELTRAQFARFLQDKDRASADGDDTAAEGRVPVVDVTWADAVEYCQWLTDKVGREKDQCYEASRERPPRDWPFHSERAGYRLPTEAEWEYACRAGTTTAYGFGSDRELLGYYAHYLEDGPAPGCTLRPSLRGLFDMHGNVWEWCQDRYQRQFADAVEDPLGPPDGSNRVVRGGGWDRSAWHCRSAYRHSPTPDYRSAYNGFRLVRTLTAKEWPAAGRQ
jgi:formylglycine-generating enzyme required for sulfatase activity